MKGFSYEHICGQAKAYQKGDTNAFLAKLSSIDGVYVDGISITLGSPRKYVWTYASGLSHDYSYNKFNCPCATTAGPNPPAFVGTDYYCESGNVGVFESSNYYLSDPLWDGNGCTNGNGCCAQIGMPYGSTAGYHFQLQKILKSVFVKMKAMLPRILQLKNLSCMCCKLYNLSYLNINCSLYMHPSEFYIWYVCDVHIRQIMQLRDSFPLLGCQVVLYL